MTEIASKVRYGWFIACILLMLVAFGAAQRSVEAKVNAPNINATAYDPESDGNWRIRLQAPASGGGGGGETPTNIGDIEGYGCDLEDKDVCLDNEIVYTITHGGETNRVTVNFSENVYIGKFADGLNRHITPVSGSCVTVNSISFSGSSANVDGLFADINPNTDAYGLLPDRGSPTYGNYSASETVMSTTDPGTPSAQDPLVICEDASFVMGLRTTYTTVDSWCGSSAIDENCLRAVIKMTVLTQMPPGFGKSIIAPPIGVVGAKPLMEIGTDVDFTRLFSSALFAAPADFEAIKRRWVYTTEVLSVGDSTGNIISEGGRAFRSEWLTDDYAANRAQNWYGDLFALGSSSLSHSQRREALAAMVSWAQDLFYATFSCTESACTYIRPFLGGAGQGIGKGPAAALFVTLATNTKYAVAFSNLGTHPGTGFPETAHSYPYPYQEISQINLPGKVWGDYSDDVGVLGAWSEGLRRYWAAVVEYECYEGGANAVPSDPTECPEGDGNRTSRDPYGITDGPGEHPGAGYMGVTAGGYRALAVLMEVWPGFKTVINYNAIVDYAKRLSYQGLQAAGDTCAPPDPRESALCLPWKADSTGANCDYALFTAGDTSTVTYGPHPNDPTQCVPNSTTCTDPQNGSPWTCVAANPGDANYGQTGRFPGFHGATISFFNTVSAAEDVFDTVIPNN